jgi:hypothetical protein
LKTTLRWRSRRCQKSLPRSRGNYNGHSLWLDIAIVNEWNISTLAHCIFEGGLENIWVVHVSNKKDGVNDATNLDGELLYWTRGEVESPWLLCQWVGFSVHYLKFDLAMPSMKIHKCQGS